MLLPACTPSPQTTTEDGSYAPSAGSVPVEVAAAPNFFQVVSGYLIQFAQFFHLFGR